MRTVGPAVEAASGLEAFEELERFLSEAEEARLGLSELERGSERRGRELLRLSLQAHLDSRGDGMSVRRCCSIRRMDRCV
jgi:hypothetical protein